MKLRFTPALLAWILVAGLLGESAWAMDRCRAKIARRDGTILVYANNVSGPLRWRWDAHSPPVPVLSGPCHAGATVDGCALAEVGATARTTPPPRCFLDLLDDTVGPCRAYVRGCIPGTRDDSPALPSALQCMFTQDEGRTVVFEGCNVAVRAANGATDGDPTGTGNLFVGWNEGPHTFGQSGSHNLIFGEAISFSGYGALVNGAYNWAEGGFSAILSSRESEADSGFVGGGRRNYARFGFVLGGMSNRAVGGSVLGGTNNEVSGEGGVVAGGLRNTAAGQNSCVLGGGFNVADGAFSTSVGGWQNRSVGGGSFTGGGRFNSAIGYSVTGAEGAPGVLGGQFNTATGFHATVTGGSMNSASGLAASVSGGLSRHAGGDHDWVAGELFEDE